MNIYDHISYLIKNWKTSLIGLGIALSLGLYDHYVNGTLHKTTIGGIVLVILYGFVTKDVNVTGGDTANAVTAKSLPLRLSSSVDYGAKPSNANTGTARDPQQERTFPRTGGGDK